MSTNYAHEASTALNQFRFPPASSSTFPSHHMQLNVSAAVASDSISEEDLEELEWDALFAQPHVKAGLARLAAEAERQIVAGEIEEGGFAVE